MYLIKQLYRNPNSVGLDITHSVVKLVEFTYQKKSLSLAGYALSLLVSHWFYNNKAVAQAIRKAVAFSKTKKKYAITALSSSDVIRRVIELENCTQDDYLEAQIYSQASRFIPYPLEDINLDYELLRTNQDITQALVVASKQKTIDRRVNEIKQGGLVPKVIEVDIHALERALLLNQDFFAEHKLTHLVLLFDISIRAITLTVIHNLKAIDRQEETFNEEQLIEFLVNFSELLINQEAILTLEKKFYKNHPEEKINIFYDQILQKINYLVQFFYSKNHYYPVDKIVLSGEGARLPQLCDFIQDKLKVNCYIANPFAYIKLSSHINADKLQLYAPSLLVACGLAQRGIAH